MERKLIVAIPLIIIIYVVWRHYSKKKTEKRKQKNKLTEIDASKNANLLGTRS